MAANKSAVPEENNVPEYTHGQQAVLKLLQWAAWMAAFVAMLYVMHG